MKSGFNVKEMTWQDKHGDVKRLRTKVMNGCYIAFNERPPQICIPVTSGPDDMDRQRDIIIDVKSLVKELKKFNLV